MVVDSSSEIRFGEVELGTTYYSLDDRVYNVFVTLADVFCRDVEFPQGIVECVDRIEKALSSPYSFFVDFENLRFYTSVVEVYGDFSEFFEPFFVRGGGRRERVFNYNSFEDFCVDVYANGYDRYMFYPFVVVKFGEGVALFLDRGYKYKMYVNRKRVFSALRYLSSMVRWKKKKSGKYTNHVVLTVTIPHGVPYNEAHEVMRKRVRQILSYFRRKYGIKGYLGVLELHGDGYPHYHFLIVLEKYLRVFKHKGVWRFDLKRVWDSDLVADKHGFIDVFAIKSVKGLVSYFGKYVGKSVMVSFDDFHESRNDYVGYCKSNAKKFVYLYSRFTGLRLVLMDRRTARVIKKKLYSDDVIDRIREGVRSYYKKLWELRNAQGLLKYKRLDFNITQFVFDLLVFYAPERLSGDYGFLVDLSMFYCVLFSPFFVVGWVF